MNIKTILSLIIITFAIAGSAQNFLTTPEWEVTLHVVDKTGKPVPDAQARVGFIKPNSGDRSDSIDGMTDTNGLFTASGRSYSRLYLNVKKAGYYSAGSIYDIYVTDKPRYEPWDPTITLVLKKVINPIPMYAKSLNTHIPDLDKPVGYDLTVGDWVGPYGKGINADIFFTGHFDKYTNGESDFTLTVTFPNAGDGIQEFTVPDSEKSGGLRSPYEAPTNGYFPQWVQTDSRRPGKPIETNRDPNRNYFFRVQTKIDDRGNIVSAHYGKIYGDFMEFKYYLNPTINDRNVEFNPKENLMTNLKFGEGVSQP